MLVWRGRWVIHADSCTDRSLTEQRRVAAVALAVREEDVVEVDRIQFQSINVVGVDWYLPSPCSYFLFISHRTPGFARRGLKKV
jgi:hypothetical protein